MKQLQWINKTSTMKTTANTIKRSLKWKCKQKEKKKRMIAKYYIEEGEGVSACVLFWLRCRRRLGSLFVWFLPRFRLWRFVCAVTDGSADGSDEAALSFDVWGGTEEDDEDDEEDEDDDDDDDDDEVTSCDTGKIEASLSSGNTYGGGASTDGSS